MNLSSWGGVKGAAIEDDDVVAFIFLLNVGQNCHYFSVELGQSVILVVKIFCLGVLDGVIEHEFCWFGYFLSSEGDLVVESVWDW